MGLPDPAAPRDVRVPAHAWTWLQRSRPVLAEISHQLYGQVPDAEVLTRLRSDFAGDRLVQDVVAGVVCAVAFGGRVPTHRPAASRWDRGLVWWAAFAAGVPVTAFEAAPDPVPAQAPLFGAANPVERAVADAAVAAPPAPPSTPPRPRVVSRAAVVAALQDLLASGDGTQVPAAAIRQLLAQVEAGDPDRPA